VGGVARAGSLPRWIRPWVMCVPAVARSTGVVSRSSTSVASMTNVKLVLKDPKGPRCDRERRPRDVGGPDCGWLRLRWSGATGARPSPNGGRRINSDAAPVGTRWILSINYAAAARTAVIIILGRAADLPNNIRVIVIVPAAAGTCYCWCGCCWHWMGLLVVVWMAHRDIYGSNSVFVSTTTELRSWGTFKVTKRNFSADNKRRVEKTCQHKHGPALDMYEPSAVPIMTRYGELR